MQCVLEIWRIGHQYITSSACSRLLFVKNIEYEMFQPDLDVCLNFTCVRWHHHIYAILYYIDTNKNTLFQDLSD